MIYLFSGDDTKKKLIGLEKFIKTLPKNVEVFSINKNDFGAAQIESFYSSQGLFFNKCVILFYDISEKEEAYDFLLKKLENMQESQNLFIFSEGKMNKSDIEVFKKKKAEINIFELPKEKKERYDNFLLAYDFEKRDKLNLWIHFRQAMDLGVGMEELVGVLFWKAKDMLLKKNFNKVKEEELKEFVSKISYILPEARKKGIDDEAAFEKFILEAF